MTANVDALLPGVPVLFDTDEKWARKPLRGQRGVVVHRYDAAFGVATDVVVCVGPCDRANHSVECHSAVAFSPDELLLVPDEQPADAGHVSTAVALLLCLFGALLLLAVLAVGQRGMCRMHDDHLRYCPGYSAGEGTTR